MQFDAIHTYQQSADEVFAALIDFEAVRVSVLPAATG